jgi:hypothetical protein
MVTDMSLYPVLDVFQKHSAGIVALFFHPQPSDITSVTPGPKTKQKPGNLMNHQIQSQRWKFVICNWNFDGKMVGHCRVFTNRCIK